MFINSQKVSLLQQAKVIKRFSISIATPRRDSTSQETLYEVEEEIEGSGLVNLTCEAVSLILTN